MSDGGMAANIFGERASLGPVLFCLPLRAAKPHCEKQTTNSALTVLCQWPSFPPSRLRQLVEMMTVFSGEGLLAIPNPTTRDQQRPRRPRSSCPAQGRTDRRGGCHR